MHLADGLQDQRGGAADGAADQVACAVAAVDLGQAAVHVDVLAVGAGGHVAEGQRVGHRPPLYAEICQYCFRQITEGVTWPGELLLVAEHTRSANPYRLLYATLGIDEPEDPRTKPSCCDAEGQPPINPDLVERFEHGLRDLGRVLPGSVRTPSRRRR